MGCLGKQADSICGAHPSATRGGDYVRWKCLRIRIANSDARIKPEPSSHSEFPIGDDRCVSGLRSCIHMLCVFAHNCGFG